MTDRNTRHTRETQKRRKTQCCVRLCVCIFAAECFRCVCAVRAPRFSIALSLLMRCVYSGCLRGEACDGYLECYSEISKIHPVYLPLSGKGANGVVSL